MLNCFHYPKIKFIK